MSRRRTPTNWPQITALAHHKGGVGKTTLALSLADALGAALLDADPTGAIAGVLARRDPAREPVELLAGDAAEILALEHPRQIVIDCPGFDAPSTRAAIARAGLVIVPCKASPLDLDVAGASVEQVRALRPDVPLCVVLTMTKARAAITDLIREQLEGFGETVLTATVGDRVEHIYCLLEGASALTTAPKSKAAQEIRAVVAEISKGVLRG